MKIFSSSVFQDQAYLLGIFSPEQGRFTPYKPMGLEAGKLRSLGSTPGGNLAVAAT